MTSIPEPRSDPPAPPPANPSVTPTAQPGLPDKTTKPGQPLTLYGIPCRLLEFKVRGEGAERVYRAY
jgi:hypothetical protein